MASKDPVAVVAKEIQEDTTKRVEEYIDKIHYSDRYSDDEYEYRHVILPKPLYKMIPKNLFNPDKSGTLRLLNEEEWRGIGITQSLGWEHYEVHAPEPHVLLFRRRKDFVAPTQPQYQPLINGKFRQGKRK
ncbi:cyclin-dependent kinase regulatory subunit [Amylocystis lapponica]|nr:cyclin-dependent kinase regulatory subunit [Amylocystis lapponica]